MRPSVLVLSTLVPGALLSCGAHTGLDSPPRADAAAASPEEPEAERPSPSPLAPPPVPPPPVPPLELVRMFAGSAGGLALDSRSNVYVVGSFGGSIDFGRGPVRCAGKTDAFLVKLDPRGEVVWAKTFGTTVEDSAFGVVVDPRTDGVTILGWSQGAIDLGLGPLTDGFARNFTATSFTASYDAEGSPLASTLYGDTSVRSIAGTAQGFFIGGLEATGMGRPSGMSAIYFGHLDATLHPAGIVAMAEGGYPSSVAVDATGGLVMAGDFDTSLRVGDSEVATSDKSATDCFVSRLTPDGEHLWTRSFVGSIDEVKLTGDSLLVAGECRGNRCSAPNVLPHQAQVTKLGARGDVLWTRGFGSGGYGQATSIAPGLGGGSFVTGRFNEKMVLGEHTFTSHGSTDIFLAKLDSEGRVVQGYAFGSTGLDFAARVVTDAEGAAYAVGRVGGVVDFGSGPITPPAGDGSREGPPLTDFASALQDRAPDRSRVTAAHVTPITLRLHRRAPAASKRSAGRSKCCESPPRGLRSAPHGTPLCAARRPRKGARLRRGPRRRVRAT